MRVDRLWLHDFRSWVDAELDFATGLNLIVGDNGNGKTNLIEAIAYVSRLKSFRGAPVAALVRAHQESAFVRAQVFSEGRDVLIEAEIAASGKHHLLVNKQKPQRARDVLGSLNVTVFAPDDLELIKGAPGVRRGFLDDVLVGVHPKNEQARSDYEKILKQRNALLKQMKGRREESALVTLDVWDERIIDAGERLAGLRRKLAERLSPLVTAAYQELSGTSVDVAVDYVADWAEVGLEGAIAAGRDQDIRRGLTLVGPHRDDLWIGLARMNSRTHASQGEQRCLALALRLASHHLVTDATGAAPVLLLDDVFSELDPTRARALTDSLPAGQTIVTTATDIPSLRTPDREIRISDSTVRA